MRKLRTGWPTAGLPEGFEYTSSGKVACSTCGRSGYWGGTWVEPCQRGHEPCAGCGRQLSVKLDGTARVHTRCPVQRTPV